VPASSGPRRVLIIEDNHDVADMLGKYLELVGHEVIVAHDGYAGLEAAWRHKPQVLICDIGLPGVDGYEIAGRLRHDPAFSSCLMIAVTGYGEVADRERARGAGYSHHLTKPADPSVIAELISEFEQP
jgi:CheY-like chemotaxis protein